MKAKKLIEVALPIKEISAESVRDKRINHGHLSTIHIWWARRPLPTCRAIVFASLVPDPEDSSCSNAFKDAIRYLLKDEKYMPYKDIPYTAVFDPMEDNLRNRLMMFIGKFSERCQANMLSGKATNPSEQLSDGSLIKWENKNNPAILRIARELIFVAYNSEKNNCIGFETFHKQFEEKYKKIIEIENNLYSIVDRDWDSSEIRVSQEHLHNAINDFLAFMPIVFDPFAGGGAIPLEAARLGCRSYGNDINPVAHIIEKCGLEFPQYYGKPIIYSLNNFLTKYGKDGLDLYEIKYNDRPTQFFKVDNRLAFDVEFYARKILKEVEKEAGNNYPRNKNGEKPVAYYWARTATCSNPTCQAKVPLLRGFYLSNKKEKSIYLSPIIEGKKINFEIRKGKCNLKGWSNRGTLTCPCCGSVTSVDLIKEQSLQGELAPRPLAVVWETSRGKQYTIPDENTLSVLQKKFELEFEPEGEMQRNSGGGDTFPWGYTKWKHLFSNRQLYILGIFVQKFEEIKHELGSSAYADAIKTYLAVWIDRLLPYNTTFGIYETGTEKVQRIFGRQAIAMVFDYPESNPFCESSGSALNMLEWLTRYIESESSNSFSTTLKNVSSGDKLQFPSKYITSVVTDPPYYDAIAYADCSDFFYVWLKKTLSDIYPLEFATPLTPKSEECTAIKHHHDNDENKAKIHFESKLTQIFDSIEKQTEDIVSIMFAHQSTEAWTTLCNSILSAKMNITGSWPMDTEMAGALKTEKAFLESSVTVACRPSERKGYGDYRKIKKDIENKVQKEVESLYELGFRGADLLTACFGQAVSEFGKYKSVEKSDGSEVTVAELLEMARNAAFDSLLKGVQGDDFTKFYIGWLQLNGTGETDFDDATKFTRVGVNVNIKDIQQEGLLILEGNKMHIAMAEEHLGKSSVVGTRPEDSPISQAHRFIVIYREGDRGKILHFVRDICPEASSPLWRLLATLKELLPANDDQKQISGILQNAEDLRQHCHEEYQAQEGDLFEGMDI